MNGNLELAFRSSIQSVRPGWSSLQFAVNRMSKSNEVIWWSLFSAGGVLAALFIPAFIVVTGFLLPAVAGEDPSRAYDIIRGTLTWPVRVVVFIVIFLSFFHCAHRVRHTLMDLGLRHMEGILMTVCYLGASLGTIVAAVMLVKM